MFTVQPVAYRLVLAAQDGYQAASVHVAGHVDAALGACEALIHANIPYGVITTSSLSDLSRHRVVVLPNVLMLGEEEAEAFRRSMTAGAAGMGAKVALIERADLLCSNDTASAM